MSLRERLYENYDTGIGGNSIGSKLKTGLKNNWKTLAGGAALGGLGHMLGNHFSDDINDSGNEFHKAADGKSGDYWDKWMDKGSGAFEKGKGIFSKDDAGTNTPTPSAPVATTNGTQSLVPGAQQPYVYNPGNTATAATTNGTQSPVSGNTATAATTNGTQSLVPSNQYQYNGEAADAANKVTADHQAEVDKLKKEVGFLKTTGAFNNKAAPENPDSGFFANTNLMRDGTPDAEWAMKRDSGNYFGRDNYSPIENNAKDYTDAQKEDAYGQNINKIHSDWMKTNETAGVAQAKTMEDLKAAMNNADADGSRTPEEKANINKMLLKAAGQQPDNTFDAGDIKQGLEGQGQKISDLKIADAKDNVNDIESKNIDNMSKGYGKTMADKDNADLAGAVKFAKDHGMTKLLDNNPVDDLTYFRDLEKQGIMPDELRPLQNRLMAHLNKR